MKSEWPDGPCCKNCAYWNQVAFGYGYCERVGKSDQFNLSDPSGLQTVPTFLCVEYDVPPITTSAGSDEPQ